MAIVKNRNSKRIDRKSKSRLVSARVIDIITDINHPRAEEFGGPDAIGTIFYADIKSPAVGEDSKYAFNAKPLFIHLKYYPLINEVVLLVTSTDKDIYTNKFNTTTYYLPLMNMWNSPHHNALPLLGPLKDDPNTSNDYQNSEAGLVRRSTDKDTNINLGKYFNEKLNIKPLFPYEGDLIFEGRFGNSIRFGATAKQIIKNSKGENVEVIPEFNKNNWSNTTEEKGGEIGDPIIIIRNGQNEKEDDRGWIHTVENINDDPSSIYLTSNQSLEGFKPASLHMGSFGANLPEPEELKIVPTPKEEPKEVVINKNLPNEIPDDIVDEPQENPTPVINDNPETQIEETIDGGELDQVDLIEQVTEQVEEDELDPFNNLADETEVGIFELEDGTDNIDIEILDNTLTVGEITTGSGFFSGIGEWISTYNNNRTIITPTELAGGIGRFYTLGSLCYSSDTEKENKKRRAKGEPEITNVPGQDDGVVLNDEGHIGPSKDTVMANLKNVMENFLDPLIDQFGLYKDSPRDNRQGIKITSGYRSLAVNTLIGGSKTSQHTYGEAIDFRVYGFYPSEVLNWAVANLPRMNQIIWEWPAVTWGGWIHLGVRKSGKNRNGIDVFTKKDEILSFYKGGTAKTGTRSSSKYATMKEAVKLYPNKFKANKEGIIPYAQQQLVENLRNKGELHG